MELKELQEHIRALVTLEESEAPVVSVYMNLQKDAAELRQFTKHRVGLLKDIATTLAKFGVNIIKIESSEVKKTAEIHLVAIIKSKSELPRMLFRLKKINGVIDTKSRFV